ncbi:flagellar hook-associated protein FlgK [Paenalcaligenes faecalis]|uniref:flagellar hook-associated protein FlgK n=1 Tax=Paenalcaligenes faecalis TaxID=2980099 RepID=UPI0022B971D8|nr:flagellar hook-associated protein FlgK [Paenalcaligenes faecalis]
MNLFGLGLSALNTAQNNLQTTGHNINNAAVEGYNRQSVLTQTNGARATGAGYIGRGVQAVTVQRAYDGFLHNQLVKAQSDGAALVSYGNEIAQLNNLFADRTTGVSPAIQKFFDSVQAVASTPADPAARQEMIGRADSLATQINEANRFIDNQRHNLNTQIDTVVAQINSYVERIDDMNQQITKAKASGVGNHAPNDLLDQRDQLVSELNQLVGVKVLEQDGNFSLTLNSGQVLLGGPTIYPLHAVPSAADPKRYAIATTSGFINGKPVLAEVADTSIKSGQLGGLLQYRADTLDPAQNALGRLAVGMAVEFNQLHKQGFDLNSGVGTDFFKVSIADTATKAHSNKGTGEFKVDFIREDQDDPDSDVTGIAALTAQDYEIKFEGNAYHIRALPSGGWDEIDKPEGFEKDGLFIKLEGKAQEGDVWRLQPTRNSADSFKVEMRDPSKIAAAGKDDQGNALGTANGDIALDLAKLQSEKTLGMGSMSFNDAYSQLVNRVAVNSQQNSTAAKAQKNLIQQNYAAQQAVSGVNLNEEYVMLDRYADQFRAASRLIDVGSTLFDTILGLRN